MATLEQLKEDKIIEYSYGKYRLKIRYPADETKDFASVSMSDVSQLRFPLLWSMGMNKSQAAGAIELFKQTGYFDMPIGRELNANRTMSFYED